MPWLSVNGAQLYYEVTGNGEQTIVFAHGLLWSGEMFAAQVAAFSPRYRCVTFDFRGQGRSEVTASGYDMDTLARDAALLIERLVLGRVHFAGLSMGGFVALRLAARRPDLLRSAIVLESSADEEPKETVGRYKLLGNLGWLFGYEIVAGRVMPIMFGKTFMTDRSRKAERARWRKRLIHNDRNGIRRALKGVVERAPIYPELSGVRVPTLVIVGDEDVATVPAKAERIAAAVPGAELVVIPHAGHSSTIEEPAAVNAAIARFLERLAALEP
jgi:pimeloyl-ACP methyl ester carboxylesterase